MTKTLAELVKCLYYLQGYPGYDCGVKGITEGHDCVKVIPYKDLKTWAKKNATEFQGHWDLSLFKKGIRVKIKAIDLEKFKE